MVRLYHFFFDLNASECLCKRGSMVTFILLIVNIEKLIFDMMDYLDTRIRNYEEEKKS